MMLLSAYNLGGHLAVGALFFRQQKERSGYRAALLASTTALVLLLFLLIHFSWDETWEAVLSVIAQQSSIPMALIALAWLSRFRFADLFVKQSFLILAAVLVALAYQWLIVAPLAAGLSHAAAQSEATRQIVTTVLWAAALLCFPLLRRQLNHAADRWIFKRPDYRAVLQAFQQAAERCNDEAALFALVEQQAVAALRVPAVKVEPAQTEAEFVIHNQAGARYALNVTTGGQPLLSDEIALLASLCESAGRRLEAMQFERERREQALREAKLQQLLTEAELKALRAQINPHFLFNTLNTIADLIAEAPDRAEQLTEQLAEIFRHALSRTQRNLIALEEEFAFLRTYLEIEQARFGERLRVEMQLDPRLAGRRIPSLLLQPLVENAVKHGLATQPAGGTVRIEALNIHNHLQLIVADDGGGWRHGSSNGSQLALHNVTERLHMLYGGRAQLDVSSAAGKGTRITITIPANETANETHDETQDAAH